MRTWFLVPVMLCLATTLSRAQAPLPEEMTRQVTSVQGQCQAQVEEQHRQLTTDRLLTAAPGMRWQDQLTAIASKVRTLRTEYEVKENQEKLAVSNIAELVELRRRLQQDLDQLRAQNAELTAERDKLKAAVSAPVSPSN